MSGANRSRFDWKEITKALRVTTAAPASFWRELRGARSNEVKPRSPATVIKGERECDSGKVGKTDASAKR